MKPIWALSKLILPKHKNQVLYWTVRLDSQVEQLSYVTEDILRVQGAINASRACISLGDKYNAFIYAGWRFVPHFHCFLEIMLVFNFVNGSRYGKSVKLFLHFVFSPCHPSCPFRLCDCCFTLLFDLELHPWINLYQSRCPVTMDVGPFHPFLPTVNRLQIVEEVARMRDLVYLQKMVVRAHLGKVTWIKGL